MRLTDADLERARRIIEDGERRIAAQEDLIERLRADGHKTDRAGEFLRSMRELLKQQVRLRDELDSSSRIRIPRAETLLLSRRGSQARQHPAIGTLSVPPRCSFMRMSTLRYHLRGVTDRLLATQHSIATLERWIAEVHGENEYRAELEHRLGHLRSAENKLQEAQASLVRRLKHPGLDAA